jgi:dephospho-CoA kinase
VFHIGLTGNVGAGKSTVVALFASWGATVIDTDILAREVVQPGGPTLKRIREEFGDEVIAEDGGLNRPAMRRIAFSDDQARERLENIIHPAIGALYGELLAEAEARDDRIVIGVVPLLFETGMGDKFDAVVVVDAPTAVRIERLVGKRGLTPDEARAVADSQMASEEKRRLADLIIDNDSDIPTLERRAWETWKEIEKLSRAA